MKNRSLLLFATIAFAASTLLPTAAFSDLMFVTDISVAGSGLGAVSTLVTIHDTGNGNGIESGCITQNGSFSPCLNDATTHVEGGDNTAINNVLSFSTNQNFAAVVNTNETGQDLSVTLTDLYLTFVGSNGTHTAEYLGPSLVLTSGTGTGIGMSGFVFRLSDSEFALVELLGNSVTVSGGFQFAEGTTNAGPETLYVVQLPAAGSGGGGPAGTSPVPEPASLLLLGTGLSGVAWLRRRHAETSR